MTRAVVEAEWDLNTAQNGVVKLCVYTGTKIWRSGNSPSWKILI